MWGAVSLPIFGGLGVEGYIGDFYRCVFLLIYLLEYVHCRCLQGKCELLV